MTQPSTSARDLPTVAVGAVIWNARWEVLLIRRAREPLMGEWSIPGGKVAFGETMRAALAREVREETGLEIEILELIDVVDFFTPEKSKAVSHHYLLIDFTAKHLKGDPKAASDASDAKWVPPGQLDRYELWSETRRIIALSARQMGIAD